MIYCANTLIGNFMYSKSTMGGVVVEIVDIRSHEQLQYGGDDTVEEDLGCDQA